MWFHFLFDALFVRSSRSLSRKRRPASSIRRRPRFVRPHLEILEDRTLLSTYTVDALTDTGAGSGLTGDLRYCVTNATSGNDTFTFAPGLTGTINLDGAMTGDWFVAYVEQQLVPTRRRGDIVVMDNLSCHKRAAVRRAIEKAGCELRLLPAYSPDLNPIAKAFSKLKAKLRAAAKRTVEELWKYLGEVIDEFTPNECRNYFHNCGYSDARSIREPL